VTNPAPLARQYCCCRTVLLSGRGRDGIAGLYCALDRPACDDKLREGLVFAAERRAAWAGLSPTVLFTASPVTPHTSALRSGHCTAWAYLPLVPGPYPAHPCIERMQLTAPSCCEQQPSSTVYCPQLQLRTVASASAGVRECVLLQPHKQWAECTKIYLAKVGLDGLMVAGM